MEYKQIFKLFQGRAALESSKQELFTTKEAREYVPMSVILNTIPDKVEFIPLKRVKIGRNREVVLPYNKDEKPKKGEKILETFEGKRYYYLRDGLIANLDMLICDYRYSIIDGLAARKERVAKAQEELDAYERNYRDILGF